MSNQLSMSTIINEVLNQLEADKRERLEKMIDYALKLVKTESFDWDKILVFEESHEIIKSILKKERIEYIIALAYYVAQEADCGSMKICVTKGKERGIIPISSDSTRLVIINIPCKEYNSLK